MTYNFDDSAMQIIVDALAAQQRAIAAIVGNIQAQHAAQAAPVPAAAETTEIAHTEPQPAPQPDHAA